MPSLLTVLDRPLQLEVADWRQRVLEAGSSLRSEVLMAVDSFVWGCKQDPSPNPGVSNWDAMKSVVLLAGPDTFAGLAVPLKGAAPTFSNFVSGDYDPADGLTGGVSKSINTNIASNSFPQNNFSVGTWVSNFPPVGTLYAIYGDGAGTGRTNLLRQSVVITGIGGIGIRCRNNGVGASDLSPAETFGLVACSRSSSSSFEYAALDLTGSVSQGSQTPPSNTGLFFARPEGDNFPGTLGFCFMGESVNLRRIRTRLTTLMAAIAAAHQ
jgi:hypothetical protein